MNNARRSRGFTLIELLIVVAIIGILAAIAIPNFLMAQVRSKVARCQSDMRTLSVALELYAVDHTAYPLCESTATAAGLNSWHAWLSQLTTPIGYINDIPEDPFDLLDRSNPWSGYGYHEKWAFDVDWGTGAFERDQIPPELRHGNIRWVLNGRGPDHIEDWQLPVWMGHYMQYDATNGTVSAGDIRRYGP
jgi:type II secretion system protein G